MAKRTKQVFKPEELAHVWLRQSQNQGRTAGTGNFYFNGDTIYSYGSHFPIARLFDAPNGELVILMTTRSYSMSTSGHIGCVQRALRNSCHRVVYCHTPSIDFGTHEKNLREFKSEFDKVVAKHSVARKPEMYEVTLFNVCRSAREYCEVMCLDVPRWASMPDGIEPGAPLKAAIAVFSEEAQHG